MHFHVQWIQCGRPWKLNISYLFWTLRMSSLCIFGPFSFCPLSVHHAHCLQRMAVLINSVSNVAVFIRLLMRWYSLRCAFDLWWMSVPSSYPVFSSNVMSMFTIRKRVGFAGLVGECVGNRSLEVEARCGQSLGKLLWTVTSGWS